MSAENMRKRAGHLKSVHNAQVANCHRLLPLGYKENKIYVVKLWPSFAIKAHCLHDAQEYLFFRDPNPVKSGPFFQIRNFTARSGPGRDN
jgi:hypothetical protein